MKHKIKNIMYKFHRDKFTRCTLSRGAFTVVFPVKIHQAANCNTISEIIYVRIINLIAALKSKFYDNQPLL